MIVDIVCYGSSLGNYALCASNCKSIEYNTTLTLIKLLNNGLKLLGVLNCSLFISFYYFSGCSNYGTRFSHSCERHKAYQGTKAS